MAKNSAPGAAAPQATAAQPLDSRSLRALRARAHALKPVVWIASNGASEGVLRELDRALSAHELVKIHAAIDDREERGRVLRSLCEALGAQPVQTIGKMLVAFRARPQPDAAPSERFMSGKPGKKGASKAPARRSAAPARSRSVPARRTRPARKSAR
jgi:putative YhbY family RNA-binding protein